MKRQTQFFSALVLGAAVAIGSPAAGQEDSPEQREQQQEQQREQQEQQREQQQQRQQEQDQRQPERPLLPGERSDQQRPDDPHPR